MTPGVSDSGSVDEELEDWHRSPHGTPLSQLARDQDEADADQQEQHNAGEENDEGGVGRPGTLR